MARFYIVSEDYFVTRTDDEAIAISAAQTDIVIDTQKEVELQPEAEEGDSPIEEHIV